MPLDVHKFGLAILDLEPGEVIAIEKITGGYQCFRIMRREPLKMRVWVAIESNEHLSDAKFASLPSGHL